MVYHHFPKNSSEKGHNLSLPTCDLNDIVSLLSRHIPCYSLKKNPWISPMKNSHDFLIPFIPSPWIIPSSTVARAARTELGPNKSRR